MAYTTSDNVRVVTGLSTSDISDANLTSIIVYADAQIDKEAHVTLSVTQKEMASNYLSASIVLMRLATATSASPGSYSLDRLRVDNRSAVAVRMSMAANFKAMYNVIIELNRDGTDILQLET